MNRFLSTIFGLLLFTISFGQTGKYGYAPFVNNGGKADNILTFKYNAPILMYEIHSASTDSLFLKFGNVIGAIDSINRRLDTTMAKVLYQPKGFYLHPIDTANKWWSLSYVPSQTDVIGWMGYTPANNASISTLGFSGVWGDIISKPSFSTVATSGNYTDLSGKPTLFNGVFSSLTGTPTTLSGYGISDAYPLSSNPAGYLTTVPAQSFASLTGKPTTITGYGITDAYPLTGNPSSFLTSITSLSVTNALGYTPPTLTGTGASGTWVINITGTASNNELPLTFSSPLSRSVNTVSIPLATNSVDGYMSATDRTSFNAKQSAITLTTTGNTGAATLTGATLNIPTPALTSGTVTSVGLTSSDITVTGTSPITSSGSYTLSLPAVNSNVGSFNNVTVNAKGQVTAAYNNLPDTATLTIQTVAASANGVQISTTRGALVGYSATIVSTSSITGSQNGYIVLEVCATNSTTASDWIEKGRITNGQSYTLAIAIQGVCQGGGQVMAPVPAGYYHRLRSVFTTGAGATSPTFTFNSGWKLLQ